MPSELVLFLKEESDVLLRMWEVAVEQREALKEGRLSALQDLMKEFQSLSSKALAMEASRERKSLELGKRYDCRPVLTDFVRVVPDDDDAEALRQGGIELLGVIKKLRAEMRLLERLLQEQSLLSELLTNEWRRMEGIVSADPTKGSLDFRG